MRKLHLYLPTPSQWLTAICLVLVFGACGTRHHKRFSPEERLTTDSIVKAQKDLAMLDSLRNRMKQQDNKLGEMTILREKGKILRNESQFAAALSAHGEGLRLAELTGDTIEWVQALNNIGTDYRRMGILDMAQRYHYAAWMMAKAQQDTLFVVKKNRVMSLNGLANVYMTTNNLERADSVLRLALAGEAALGSLTGQAINYANLGSIFEQRGKTDSAWAYYRRSMALNQQDNNRLGVALCHTYFGDMYRKQQLYDRALKEYDQAYTIMKDSRDEWHTLNAIIALANIYALKGDNAKAKSYLDQSLQMAKSIGSKEHLAQIYQSYYTLYKQQGDFRQALSCHERACALKDSLIDMDKVNRMQNTTLDLERNQQDLRMAEAKHRLDQEQTMRYASYIVFFIIVLLMGSLIALLYHARQVKAKSHKALKRLNEVRETFFTNITHEFRTPLTVILGLSQDLQQQDTSAEECREMGKAIQRQGQCILRLINQLLDISKIKSEIGTPDWRQGDLGAYIGMIVEAYTHYAEKRGITLLLQTKGMTHATCFVPDYMNKVVSNLLSNALKFTPRGGTVRVVLWQEEQHLGIDVADNGQGIPQHSLPHIFEAFYQADNTGNDIGTGVGLALVHQIILNLGGSITVESAVGKGTTFHILLPIRKDDHTPALDSVTTAAAQEAITLEDNETTAKALDDATTAEEDKPAEAKRVLVVEDNADIAAFIGKRLNGKYKVKYAADGKIGLEKAHQWMPDLIITDLMMPVMDGMTLCRQIRQDECTSHIPIIVVTAKITEAERIEGLKAGADAYLAKPFNSEELTTRVEKLLEQRAMLRARLAKELNEETPQQAPAEEKPAMEQMSDLDRKFLTKLTDCVYLLLNGHHNVDVEAVASKLCMSYGQLNRKLTALTGYTPAQYILRIKIKKAQRMLIAHPERDFNSIATLCGFSDYSNFVRAFRKVLNVTPTQFVRSDAQETKEQ